MKPLGFPLALLLSLMSGVALSYAFAPTHLWPLAVFSVMLFYLLLQGRNNREARLLGWLFGVGYFGAGVHWVYHSLHLFGGAVAVLAALLTAVFVLVMTLFPLAVAWAWSVFRTPRACLGNALLFAGLWSLAELARGVIFGGFPWILVGYSQTDTPLGALAPVGGVYFVGFVLVLLSILVHPLARGRTLERIAVLVLVAAIGGGVWSLLGVDWSEPEGERLHVRLAQAAIPQETKFSRERLVTSLVDYVDLSRALPPEARVIAVEEGLPGPAADSLLRGFDLATLFSGNARAMNGRAGTVSGVSRADYLPLDASDSVDLVVWPETAIPTGFTRVEKALSEFTRDMDREGVDILSGGFDRDDDKSYNAVKQLTGKQQIYRKRHLVPFGEFMPMRFLLDHAASFIDIPMADLSPGTGPLEPLVIDTVPIGISICYEDVYGEEMRHVLPAATLLVNVSNDAWFGRSAAPHQHEQKARMRAMEFARPMIRVTNTGVSSAIAHDGRVFARIEQDQVGFLDVAVQPRRGETPFMTLGNGPTWLLALLSVALGAWSSAYRRIR